MRQSLDAAHLSYANGASRDSALAAPGKQALLQEEAGLSGAQPSQKSRGHPGGRMDDWQADDALMSALGLGPVDALVASEGIHVNQGPAGGAAGAPSRSNQSVLGTNQPVAGTLQTKTILVAAPTIRAYQPEWSQIAAAAQGDEAALAVLDIEWITRLDKRFLEQIDTHFTAKNEAKAFEEIFGKDPRVRMARESFIKESKKAEKEALGRLRAAHIRNAKRAVKQDPEYLAAVQNLEVLRDQDLSEVEDELRPSFDAGRQAFRLGDSAVEPPADGVTWKEGRTLTRVNFVAWGVDIFGSVDAFKKHFLEMRRVEGTKDLWMSASTAVRYEQARAWFEAQHPGNTFFSTSVGQSMRGLHQHESSLGYLGHALGFSVDFAAYENPNQDDPVAQFMLRTFGGTVDPDGQRVQGANNLDMPEGNATARIRAMGEASAAGEELPDGSAQYLEQVGTAFDQMAATSDRFQNALRADVPALRGAKELWVKAAPLMAAVAATKQKLGAARRDVRKQLQRRAQEPVTAAIIDQEPPVALLLQRSAEQEAELQLQIDPIVGTMQSVFAPWIHELQTEIADRRAAISSEDADLAVPPQVADEVLKRVDRARTRQALMALFTDRRYRGIFSTVHAESCPDYEDLKTAMRTRATAVRTAAWEAGEIAVRLEVIRRLSSDPRAVFGAVEAKKTRQGVSWHAKDTVRQPPVLQYLERGFVKHDSMGPETSRPKGVFNREFVTAMMRWGFSTGASWGKADTMHFDHEAGFAKISGNRGTKFGPKG